MNDEPKSALTLAQWEAFVEAHEAERVAALKGRMANVTEAWHATVDVPSPVGEEVDPGFITAAEAKTLYGTQAAVKGPIEMAYTRAIEDACGVVDDFFDGGDLWASGQSKSEALKERLRELLILEN